MKTTLNKIRAHTPCKPGWEKLLGSLGKTKADDEPISIIEILGSNGFDDAIWCLRAVEGRDKKLRLLAVAYARRVQHLMADARSIAALDVAERFADGGASGSEFDAARDAARNVFDGNGSAWAAAAYAALWDNAGISVRASSRASLRITLMAEKVWQEAELRRVCEACA